LPQWNCSCHNCQAARHGLILPRTQSCVALADPSGRWYLVNASPDLSFQIQGFPDLNPRQLPLRNSPLAGVLLTNADLDHVLGLFCLREAGSIDIHASAAVRKTIESSIGFESVLNSFGESRWHEPPNDFEPLDKSSGAPGLLYRALELPGKPPPFAKSAAAGAHSLAYQFQDSATGRRLLVAPDVAEVSPNLREALKSSDAVLFDGTFWSAGELGEVRPHAPKAFDMGHLTIKDSSLELLAGLPARQKVYIHINNTNPILAPGSPERKAVEAAGLTVGWDGLEFEL